MTKTFRFLSLAALLATGTVPVSMAAGTNDSGQTGSQSVTGTQTGSQQVGKPAMGATVNTPSGQYTNHTPSTSSTYTYPRSNNGGAPGVSAQSSGQPYPGVVGPTGSRQSDATNPNRVAPSGGGGADNGSSGGSGGNSTR